MHKHSSGFSLIELLVTVMIIAVLAAILFPIFGEARADDRQTQCIGNLKRIGIAIATYTQEHDGTLPEAYTDANSDGVWDNGEAVLWQSALALPTTTMRCPVLPPTARTSYGYGWWGGGQAVGTLSAAATIPLVADAKQPILSSNWSVDLRHNGLAGYLFLDGHAAMLKPDGMNFFADDFSANTFPLLQPMIPVGAAKPDSGTVPIFDVTPAGHWLNFGAPGDVTLNTAKHTLTVSGTSMAMFYQTTTYDHDCLDDMSTAHLDFIDYYNKYQISAKNLHVDISGDHFSSGPYFLSKVGNYFGIFWPYIYWGSTPNAMKAWYVNQTDGNQEGKIVYPHGEYNFSSVDATVYSCRMLLDGTSDAFQSEVTFTSKTGDVLNAGKILVPYTNFNPDPAQGCKQLCMVANAGTYRRMLIWW